MQVVDSSRLPQGVVVMEDSSGRVRTFVRGLDEQMEGGIPRGHVVLVCGTPGTMKSSLSWSILWRNAREAGSRSIYLSLEQSERSLRAQMERMGMGLAGLEERMSVIDLGTIRAEMAKAGIESDRENWARVVKGLVQEAKERGGLDLLVLDSLDAYELLFERSISRNEMFTFFESLRQLDCTVFLISEMSPDSSRYSKFDEGFLADGIIHLKLAEVSDIDVQRRIRVVKMRGTKHAPGYFTLLVEGGEFAVTKAILK
ncbi:MAG: ATPase domain-containing protein [Thermoplasmata archaeon]